MKIKPFHRAGFPFPSCDTLPDFVQWLAQTHGDKPALSWFTRREEERGYTYRELAEQAGDLRAALAQRELGQGCHAAILSENSADWIVCFLAAVSNGCVAVCVDTEQPDEDIRSMVRRSDARVLFLSPTFLSICLPLLKEGCLERIVLMGGLSSEEEVESLDDLFAQGHALREEGTALPPPPVAPHQTAEIVFTSGTTSKSKMVMLSHQAIMQNMRDASSYVNLHQKTFSSLPFYHAYGLNCAVFNSFLQGCHLYINGDLKTMMRDLHLAKADTMFAVPLMVEAIHNQMWLAVEKSGKAEGVRKLFKFKRVCKKLHLTFQDKNLDNLRIKAVGTLKLIICGGAHLSREISEEFELLDVQTLQGYGITECSPLISVNCNTVNKLGTVGLPMSTFEVKLEDGEVLVRGPAVMQGYYKDPKATAAALEDGWFHTGDLGSLDRDGFLSLTGRKKNLIVFKNGKKISPEKLEDLISPIPLVKEVMVSGTANGASADDVKLTASIFPDPERTAGLSSYEILEKLQVEIDRINADLPVYQQIQMINIRDREFAKTGTKKIKRHGS